MTRWCILFLLLGATGVLAHADPGAREHSSLRSETLAGRMLSLAEVISRVVPRMPGHRHIGSEYEQGLRRYRLKFLRGDRVIWVDVDARSGHVLRVASP